MNLSPPLRDEAYRILNGVARNAEKRAELARIETTVLCGDLLAHCNRSLGQIQRRARERINDRMEWR